VSSASARPSQQVPFTGSYWTLIDGPHNGPSNSPLSNLFSTQHPNIATFLADTVGPQESLTHEVALKTLKQIQWQARVKCFFSHPMSVFVGLILITFGVLCIPPVHIALVILKVVLYCLGMLCKIFWFLFGIERLERISSHYHQQYATADDFVSELKRTPAAIGSGS
jgi:hypothetical protein